MGWQIASIGLGKAGVNILKIRKQTLEREINFHVDWNEEEGVCMEI